MQNRPARINSEQRSAPSTWEFLPSRGEIPSLGGPLISPYFAENLSTVFACVQVISETVAMLPVHVYSKGADGSRMDLPENPVALIFGGDANDMQSGNEFVEMMTAHALLRGNAFAQIIRDARGQPIQLIPHHPDRVSVVYIPMSGRWLYDISMLDGTTRRFLPEEIFHLKDRTDDGIIGRSRLARARETFGNALAIEKYATKTFENGAAMSGFLTHPEHLGEEATKNIQESFSGKYAGVDNAGKVAVLEEGMKWQQTSVSPDDAQMLDSRRFSVESLARVFRVPAQVIGAGHAGSLSSVQEIGRWFHSHTIQPWLVRWERLIQRTLFSSQTRRGFEVEFDADLLLRGDMLTRFQAYRIGREIGVVNANELRKFEKLNPRTDPEANVYFAPANMQQEQTGMTQPGRTVAGGD